MAVDGGRVGPAACLARLGEVSRRWRAWVVAGVAVGAALLADGPAHAVTVELQDVAPDRVERQIAAAEGRLPLPGTPDVGHFQSRLADKGMKLGDAVFLRAFKAESEVEVWMEKGGRFELFATYPVCQWSGTLGPKVLAGDKQTPEGFYTVTRRRLHRSARHPRSLNLGFPNALDKALERTGDYILVHGGCASVGCFAMTDTLAEEIFALAHAAIRKGQNHVPVHVFPFRMTQENLAQHGDHEWRDFWSNLKEGYDAFEATRVPPRVGVCDKRYVFQSQPPGGGGDSGPLAGCGAMMAATKGRLRSSGLASSPPLPERKPETRTTVVPSSTALFRGGSFGDRRRGDEASGSASARGAELRRSAGKASQGPNRATVCSAGQTECMAVREAATPARHGERADPAPGRMSLGAN